MARMMITATMRDFSSSMSSSEQYEFLSSPALITEPPTTSVSSTLLAGATKATPTTQSSQFLIPLSQSLAFYFSALVLSASVASAARINLTGKVRHHPLGV